MGMSSIRVTIDGQQVQVELFSPISLNCLWMMSPWQPLLPLKDTGSRTGKEPYRSSSGMLRGWQVYAGSLLIRAA